MMRTQRPLTIPEILNWADIHRETTGKWPTRRSGGILGARFDTWSSVNRALRDGLRTLPGGSSLAQLLGENRGVRNIQDLPSFTEQQILQWADQHYQRTRAWPGAKSGAIPDSGGETWRHVQTALHSGARGLPGGSSLAQLLQKQRGVRNRKQLPSLTEEKILQWADAHHERTKDWPHRDSGPITDSPGDTWLAVEMALRYGRRKMPGGSSLALLLAEKRGAPHPDKRPDLTIEQILSWADAFHQRTGRWPHPESGTILEAPQETWCSINNALKQSSRGLTLGLSLPHLLARERGVRNQASIPRLSRKEILRWAKSHHRRTGQWPTADSGMILEAPMETWAKVDAALHQGCRGLRQAGSSLAKLLAEFVGKKHNQNLPPLSKRKILAWADAHFQRTGQWPTTASGPVVEAAEERWDLIDNALREGHRHLLGGSSLLQLLVKKRGIRNTVNPPALTEDQILRWAELHFQRTRSWPKYHSGPIADAPGETWAGVDSALRYGKRTLTGESSLAKLLKRGRGNSRIFLPVP